MTAHNAIRFERFVPLTGGVTSLLAPAGMTVAEMIDLHFPWADGLVVLVRSADPAREWEEIPTHRWRFVLPKRDDMLRIAVRLHGGNRNQTLALIATLAITVLAPHLVGAAATVFGVGLFGAGTLGATLLTAGLQIGAAFLIGRLVQQDGQGAAAAAQGEKDNYKDAAADANLLGRETFLPRIYGRTRANPADLMQPREYLTAGVPSVKRLLGFDGSTRITDVRIDGTPVTGNAAITMQTVDGVDGSPAQTLVADYAANVAIGDTLSGFSVSGVTLEDQTTPANSEPRWLHFSTPAPDGMTEIAIRFLLRGFLHATTATTEIRVPLQIQFRQKGTEPWNSLPEIHVTGKDSRTLAKEIRVRWDNEFGVADDVASIRYEFFQRVPAATYEGSSGATGDQWQAHSHFVGGTGLQAAANIVGRRHGLNIIFAEATFAKVEYEWRIRRGGALDKTALDGNYTVSGQVPWLFEGSRTAPTATWQFGVEQSNYAAEIGLGNASAIVDGNPVLDPTAALLALQSVGQNLRAVDCLAEGGLNDWNGAAWATWTWESRNPASIARNILAQLLARRGVSAAAIDDASFAAFRADCAARGWNADGIAAGEPVGEALATILRAGFGQLYLAQDRYGAHWLKDTAATPRRFDFSPRNCRRVSASWEDSDLPVGMRVKFVDENDGYRENEIYVPSPVPAPLGAWLPAEFGAVKNADHARALAEYAMLTAFHQARRYTVETDLEGIMFAPGDIVGLVTDLIDDAQHGARVTGVIDASTIVIDQEIPARAGDALVSANADPVGDDVLLSGEYSEITVLTATGNETREIVAFNGRQVTMAAPLSTTDVVGAPVAIGSQRSPVRRCVVLNAVAGEEFGMTLSLADEAPEIWAYLAQKYGWA